MKGLSDRFKVLGLIPARGGSKGVPGKNLALVGGRPLLGWVAEQALRAKSLDRVILSSDDPVIIRMAKSLGVEVPFVRPVALATDGSLIIDTIIHAVDWFRTNEGVLYDYVCLLQPTCPMGLAEDYDRAVRVARDRQADTIICVYKCNQQHPAVMYTLGRDGRADWFVKDLGWNRMARRQDLPEVYMRSGIVYVFRSRHLIETHSLYGDKLYAIEVPEERGAIDINSPLDLAIADAVMGHLSREGKL